MSVNFSPPLLVPAHSLTGFKVLSEAERTAALYSLLQQSTQVQIRFFITVLQQMARSDPMTALLSPAVGGKSLLQLTGNPPNSSYRFDAEPDGSKACSNDYKVAIVKISHAIVPSCI